MLKKLKRKEACSLVKNRNIVKVAKTSNVVAREMKAFKDLIRKHSIESLKNKKIEPIAMNSNLRK